MDKRALGERLTSLRKDKKMSQEDLASRSGVARRAIQLIEGGSGNPTIETLDSLAKTLNVSFDALAGMLPREPTTGPARQSRTDHLFDAGRLLQAISKASAPRRALILAAAFRSDRYLDDLPQEIAQELRAIVKVLLKRE